MAAADCFLVRIRCKYTVQSVYRGSVRSTGVFLQSRVIFSYLCSLSTYLFRVFKDSRKTLFLYFFCGKLGCITALKDLLPIVVLFVRYVEQTMLSALFSFSFRYRFTRDISVGK